jgi:hypothetical protein
MRYLVQVDATTFADVEDVSSPEEAIEAAKDMFDIATADHVDAHVIKTYKVEEEQ